VSEIQGFISRLQTEAIGRLPGFQDLRVGLGGVDRNIFERPTSCRPRSAVQFVWLPKRRSIAVERSTRSRRTMESGATALRIPMSSR
jgi:hypothetical protein